MRFKAIATASATLTALITFALPLTAGAAPVKAAPEIQHIVLVHYAQGNGWDPGGDPAKPGGAGGGGGGGTTWYKYSGLHWANGTFEYRLSTAPAPVTFQGSSSDFRIAIENSFAAWEAASSGLSVTRGADVSNSPGQDDPYNVVGWADLGDQRAIAITYISYNGLTKEITEVDTALNSNASFEWWTKPADSFSWGTETSGAYDVDVQNIMTHEAGHWLCLNDMYNKPASTQTMYGISAEFDLQKKSLESGDKAGIVAIYGQ